MTDTVMAAIRRSVLDVLPGVDADLISDAISLRDLGANSVDRAEIVALAMEALDVSVPAVELRDLGGLGALAAVLRRHADAR